MEVATLPVRPEMKGRGRVKVIFEVLRYWKGKPNSLVTLYDLSLGESGDCMGYGFQIGKEYLVYAQSTISKDVRPDPDFFWYGWTDVIPVGTPMLVPAMACSPGGDVKRSYTRAALRRLGAGEKPDR
jgi:hypothetical protein